MSAYRPETPHEIAEAWRRFEEALRARHERRRPWGRYKVVDNSPWRATGVSYLWLRADGGKRLAVYRDGPQPANGSYVQARAMSGDAHAMLLALPLPQPAGCAAFVYVSAHDVSGGMGGEWAILRVATSTLAWTRRGASPVAGGWDRRPLKGIGGFRLITYGCSDDGTGSQAYRSDDGGLTWTAIAGLAGVLDVMPHAINLTPSDPFGRGTLLAVADNGATIYVSPDFGTTWAEYTPATGLAAHWYAATVIPPFYGVVGLAGDGTYRPAYFGSQGPFTPGGTDGGALLAHGGTYWSQIAGGDGQVRSWDTFGAFGSGPLPAGPPIGGGPHAGGWVGTERYLHTDGDGGEVVQADAFSTYRIYRGAENHPAGLTVGVRGFAPVAGSGDGVQRDDWPPSVADGCRFVALDDDDPAHALYAIERGEAFNPFNQSPDPWLRADNTMAVDLGATYAPSMQGVATLEIWNSDFAYGV